jgi:dTDP-L-rhamnose 4-epimerase
MSREHEPGVLVVGGSGFIGTHLVKRLMEKNYEPLNLDRVKNSFLKSHSQTTIDISDKSNIKELENCLAQRYNTIVYLAADIETSTSSRRISPHVKDSLLSLSSFLESLEKSNKSLRSLEKMILISSRAVYGEGAWLSDKGNIIQPGARIKNKLLEHDWNVYWDFEKGIKSLPNDSDLVSPKPVSFYGASKFTQEQMLTFWADRIGIPITIVRLQNVIGTPFKLDKSYTSMIETFCRKYIEKDFIEIYEDGKIIRDFIDVSDVVEAIVSIIEFYPEMNKIYDVGSGQAIDLNCVANIFTKIGHDKISHNFKWSLGDVRSSYANITRTKKELNWSPKVSIESSIVNMINLMSGKYEL